MGKALLLRMGCLAGAVQGTTPICNLYQEWERLWLGLAHLQMAHAGTLLASAMCSMVSSKATMLAQCEGQCLFQST